MALPEPDPGLVFRYDFLWSREAKGGRTSSKDRPACIAVASDTEMIRRRVIILPITHSKPAAGAIGVEIPSAVRKALGLDDAPCWVIVSEYNVDNWPNAGIAPLPGSKAVYAYGHLPPGLFDKIKKEFLRLFDGRRGVRR